MTAYAWLVAAAAVVLAAPRPRVGPDGRRLSARRPMPPTVLAVVVGVALAAIGLVVAGGPGLLGGAASTPVALWALRRPAAASSAPVDDPALPLLLDLAAAAMRSGQPCAVALSLAGRSVGGRSAVALLHVAALLRLGAPPGDAWRTVTAHPLLSEIARAATRSADSGIRLAVIFETAASDERERTRSAAQLRAQRVGITALAPLGACFLPAFVCIGIVPVVLGIARTVLPNLR